MNLRNLSITVAILVALCAVAWFARRPAPPASADPRVGEPVLATDIASQAARVSFTDQGKSVELDRQPDGSWHVATYHDFPADFSKLTGFIGSLTDAKIQRLVTSRPDRLERLEFKETALTLADGSGKELWQVTLGKNADGGGRFLRYGSEQRGYLANLSLWLDTDSKNWADASLVAAKSEDVARVEVGFVDASASAVVVNRATKDEPWTAESAPEGKRLKVDRVNSLVSSITGLRFSETTAPDDEKAVTAREHSRTIKLTTFDGKTWTVSLGRKPAEERPKPTEDVSKPAGGSELAEPETPKEPEMETIPAGPVFAFVECSDPSVRINALMEKRAFQIGEWSFTSLPQTPADFWEDAAPAAPAPAPAPAPGSGATAGSPSP